MQRPARPLTLARAATVLASLPASSAPGQSPQTQVWIDVATHSVAVMPDLGFMGGLASRMAGKDTGPQLYPQSRGMSCLTPALRIEGPPDSTCAPLTTDASHPKVHHTL